MRERLLAPAEEPGLWTPPGAGTRVLDGPGLTIVCRRRSGTVERVRIAPGGVAAALSRTRAVARAEGLTELFWWIGELSGPDGVGAELEALGLEPYAEEPVLVTLVAEAPPPEVPDVVVAPVRDVDAYRRAMEVDWDAWGIPMGDRRSRRRTLAADFERLSASGIVEHHVAEVDGRVAGFSRLVMTLDAGVLMGGAVAPWARGRGAYRALVRARWDASAARGVRRLVTSAGAMSRPVLERMGFAPIGEVRLLRDPAL
ncbi:MAG: GNAT family N-acetyltransferase [Thermoleophilia bacterium]